MENKKDFRDAKFDIFLTKTIILSSKEYFRKQINSFGKEDTSLDEWDYSPIFDALTNLNNPFSLETNVELIIDLQKAFQSLSDIEQAVVFLLFQKDLTLNEASKILEVYSKTISKIKIRAIEKLRKYMKGDFDNEK